MSDSSLPIDPARIKAANRAFYDAAYLIYDEADGRRDAGLSGYLRDQFAALRDALAPLPPSALLDLGCGTGFATNAAREFFDFVVGEDLSPKMAALAAQRYSRLSFAAADADLLPFADASFAAVSALAFLHHLPGHAQLFREAHRVLMPGGLFYADHDLDRRFRRRFSLPLYFYRIWRDEQQRYLSRCPQLTTQLYEDTEIHRQGLESAKLRVLLQAAGFREVRIISHWRGMGGLFDRLGAGLETLGLTAPGWGPALRILARK